MKIAYQYNALALFMLQDSVFRDKLIRHPNITVFLGNIAQSNEEAAFLILNDSILRQLFLSIPNLVNIACQYEKVAFFILQDSILREMFFSNPYLSIILGHLVKSYQMMVPFLLEDDIVRSEIISHWESTHILHCIAEGSPAHIPFILNHSELREALSGNASFVLKDIAHLSLEATQLILKDTQLRQWLLGCDDAEKNALLKGLINKYPSVKPLVEDSMLSDCLQKKSHEILLNRI